MNAWQGFRAVLLFPVRVSKVLLLWPWKAIKSVLSGGQRLLLSARAWVLFILLIIVGLVAYYVLSDRYTPLTTEAYVQAYVIQMAPRVEGQVVHVFVHENQTVTKGELLFEIDPRPFEYQVAILEAKRVAAIQQVAQLESELSAARAEDDRLAAEAAYARLVHEQESEIFKQEATTDRNYAQAVQKYKAAQAALERSRSQVRKVEQSLAARIGDDHALVVEVEAQLAQARLNLDWSRIYAPSDGLVTDLQLREGAYTHIGRAAMTLIETSRWIVVANFRENALTWVREGQPAIIAFRGLPGRLFGARVGAIGWGVSQGQGVPSGQLPDVKVPGSWVPPAQRFQVRLTVDDPRSVPLRVGMTASVAVYTEPEGRLNAVTRFWHQVIAWLYYL
jgi:multidrug resistance efflux pump